MATYAITTSGDVVLCLSPAEARALSSLADEGAGGILTDKEAARAYIGGPAQIAAANRAIDALQTAAAVARNRRG